jgi:hypothetical protein
MPSRNVRAPEKEEPRMSRVHKCPHCSCTDTFRVHRNPREYLMLGYRAYLCAECKSRYLVFDLGKVLEWRSAP